MKKGITILFLLLSAISIVNAVEKELHMKTWHVVSPIATSDTIPTDTLHLNYQNDNPVDRFSIANSFNGNLGSPIQSKIYFSRPQNSRFIFADAYYPYVTKPENVNYYNTKKPHSNIGYNGAVFGSYRDEDNIKFLFTANANKKLNFGTTLDYIRAIGLYSLQNVNRFKGSLFGSYDGERYSASGAVLTNSIKNFESGGIKDVEDLDRPLEPQDIPVGLEGINAYGQYTYNAFIYNHSYSLGFTKEVQVTEDSVRNVFVPVTRFGHSIKLSDERKRYLENSTNTDFYGRINHYSNNLTRDTAALQTISNTLSVSIEEEFNKWMQFGLSAYLANDIEQYTVTRDSARWGHATRTRTKLGGVLSKQRGSHFRYKVLAELDVLGSQVGDFNIDGNLGGYFRLWNDSVVLVAKGVVRNESPTFFHKLYRSNHIIWVNSDLGQTFRTQMSGNFAIPTRSFSLNVSVENITNLIYFNHEALPVQHDGNVQVLAANLRQDFHVGKIHLDNNVVYQASSHQNILPLPTLALYHNLYYLDKWFDVLDVQLGVDVRYHTAYYAPNYMPNIGQFFAQEKVKIGNYPVMNVYANFKLKQVRFFLKYYHVNNLFMEGQYLSMPNYPINPAVFRVGLSWDFYN